MPVGIASANSPLAFSPNGGSVTTSTNITITPSPALSTTQAVYWNTTGSTLSTSDYLYSGAFNLSVSGTV
jgi:hypothetical protein